MARYCRFWIPNFKIIAKPLYEPMKGSEDGPLEWDKECKWVFESESQAGHDPSFGIPASAESIPGMCT